MVKGIGAFFMVVYVEYALIQNFLLDGALLYLSLKGARVAFQRRNLLFAAFLGAVFAIVYPLLVLPEFLKTVLKFAVGALLCLVAFGRVKSKNEWGRYALSCFFFYLFTISFKYKLILFGHYTASFHLKDILFAKSLLCSIIIVLILGKSFYL